MGDPQPTPLDEIVWNDPIGAQEMGGIHTNTVLPYFARSSFFDQTSNNAIITIQALHQAGMYHLIQTRQAFEGRLREMQGVEYMVTHDPSDNGTKVENSGVWVIRKQNRRKRHGMQDEVTPISSYYVNGINVYMAPSVGNIVGSRLLSAVTSLTKLLSTASTLPSFTPATGHTYLPPANKNPTPGASFQVAHPSKEGTPMPGSSTPLPATQDTSTSSKAHSASQSKSDIDYHGIHMLGESYNLSLRYGNEYMDENPIVGEPGSFRLTKSQDATLTASMSTTKSSQSLSIAPPPVKEMEVPPLKTEDLPAPVRKSTKGGEKSPSTPTAKEKREKKERRKSKVAGAATNTTPTATTSRIGTPK